MAITNKEAGVWGLDEVYNKINEGDIWDYTLQYELFSWGYQQYSGQVGDNTTVNRSSPKLIPGTPSWKTIVQAYSSQRMATKDNGTIWRWGDNSYGKTGDNSNVTKSSPMQIGADTDWSTTESAHGIGNHHALMVKTDGTMWGMGRNNYGQLGLGARANGGNNSAYSSPTQVLGSDWAAASGSYNASLGLKQDGTLWVWGNNNYGALGQNNKTLSSSPLQIPGTTWSTISTDYDNHMRLLKTDGTAWGIGYNNDGKLGIGQPSNNANRSSPTQIGGESDWTKINGGGNFMAVRSPGLMFTWGFNREGQLGNNQQSSGSPFGKQPSPVNIMEDVSDISFGREQAYSVKTNGTMWSWGHNSWGELGLNDKTFRSSPTQIPGTTWVQVSSGNNSCYARKSDGTVWSWGRNSSGALGVNNNTKYSSPVQIGTGTDWTTIEGASFGAYALTTT